MRDPSCAFRALLKVGFRYRKPVHCSNEGNYFFQENWNPTRNQTKRERLRFQNLHSNIGIELLPEQIWFFNCESTCIEEPTHGRRRSGEEATPGRFPSRERESYESLVASQIWTGGKGRNRVSRFFGARSREHFADRSRCQNQAEISVESCKNKKRPMSDDIDLVYNLAVCSFATSSFSCGGRI